MPYGSHEKKSSGENRNAVWKMFNWRKIPEASKAKNSFRTIAHAVREYVVAGLPGPDEQKMPNRSSAYAK